jgi:indolepyruvate ferredoxin oxidoreductase, beta subunit
MLWMLAKGKRIRRSTLRHAKEEAAITQWLARIAEAVSIDYALSVEMTKCQALVKGYGETHARGMRNFSTLMSAYEEGKLAPRCAARLRALRAAALADEDGKALAAALA